MYGSKSREMRPRNGHTLIVGIGARISGCANQKELSLEDQEDHAKGIVADIYQGPVEYHVIATKGKGERLNRPELAEMEALIRTRTIDLFIFEDIGRFVRGTAAKDFMGLAVDHDTRVLAPNDCLDTWDESWEEDAIAACRDHVGHNAHTSKRIKQKTMNRFLKFGGSTARPIYGYIVPQGAKTYGEWLKDPAASNYILEGARRLRECLNCTQVGDWFNAEGVPTGPYCRRKTWRGAMVRSFYSNTLLKGEPIRGRRVSKKFHETGQRRCVKNPDGPNRRKHPELAYLSDDVFDDLNEALTRENADYRRKPVGDSDPFEHRPRKRTRFPGQHSRCYYCGRQHVWGGNGVTANLMCNSSREEKCWNTISFSGELASHRIAEVITTELRTLDGFDDQFRDLVFTAGQSTNSAWEQRWSKLVVEEADLEKTKANLIASLKVAGPVQMLVDELKLLEDAELKLKRERGQLERLRNRKMVLPQSMSQIQQMLGEEFAKLAIDSSEFGELMRKLVPEIHVYNVRLLNGGSLLPRARVRLALDGVFPDTRSVVPELSALLSRTVTIDLFKTPRCEEIREEAVRLAANGLFNYQIASRIRDKPSLHTLQSSFELDAILQSRGLSSPYEVVNLPPDDYKKLRRHRGPKYKFTPEPGYQPPILSDEE